MLSLTALDTIRAFQADQAASLLAPSSYYGLQSLHVSSLLAFPIITATFSSSHSEDASAAGFCSSFQLEWNLGAFLAKVASSQPWLRGEEPAVEGSACPRPASEQIKPQVHHG